MVLICHTPSSRQEEWQAPKDTSYFGADSSRGSALNAAVSSEIPSFAHCVSSSQPVSFAPAFSFSSR